MGAENNEGKWCAGFPSVGWGWPRTNTPQFNIHSDFLSLSLTMWTLLYYQNNQNSTLGPLYLWIDHTDKFSSSQANYQEKEWLSILQILTPNGDCVNRSSHGTAAITQGKPICLSSWAQGVTRWSNQMAASCPEYILSHKLRVFSFIGRHLKDSALRFKMRT